MGNKSFWDWFIERAMGAGFFGFVGAFPGALIFQNEALGIIIGAVLGWFFTDYKINRKEPVLGPYDDNN